MITAPLLLSLLACEAEVQTFVGDLIDTDARVAVATDGENGVAYICGGEETMATHTRWFGDDIWAGELTAQTSDWEFSADVYEDGADGFLTSPDGDVWEFSLTDAGGLYQAEDAGCKDGAVLGPDANGELSLQGVWCDEVGSLAQVTPVTTLALEPTIRVQVESDSGLRSFDMVQVSP
jgi:hypothetical protein